MAGGTIDNDEGITGINIVPLVDITLVLLIIMMVTAKIIVSQSIPMDLPKATTGQKTQMIFSVQLTKDGATYVDSKRVASDEAVLGLARQAKSKKKDLRAVIQADREVSHGRVMTVLDELKRAGVAKIAFGVSPSKGGDDKKDSKSKSKAH